MVTEIEFHKMPMQSKYGCNLQRLFKQLNIVIGRKVDRLKYMFDTEILTRFYNHLLCCMITQNDLEQSFATTRESPLYESGNICLENTISQYELDGVSFFNKIQRLSVMDISTSYDEYLKKVEEVGDINAEDAASIAALYGLAIENLKKGFNLSPNCVEKEVKFYKDNHGFFCNNIFVDVIASRNVPTQKDTLKLLYNYLYARKIGIEWVQKIEYIGIYNVNHKRLFYMPVEAIPEESMREVEDKLMN